MADKQKQGALWRLLQHFQQRIFSLALKVVDGIDDGNAPAALARCRAKKRYRAPNVVNSYDGIELAGLLVDAALEYQEIALRLRGDTSDNRMLRSDSK